MKRKSPSRYNASALRAMWKDCQGWMEEARKAERRTELACLKEFESVLGHGTLQAEALGEWRGAVACVQFVADRYDLSAPATSPRHVSVRELVRRSRNWLREAGEPLELPDADRHWTGLRA